MVRLLVVWAVILVLGSIVLARGGGGLGELIITWGFFLTIPALVVLWILSLVERFGANWFSNMPIVLGVLIAVAIPAICAVFYRQQMGWDVILQAVMPISAIFGTAWALSPRIIS